MKKIQKVSLVSVVGGSLFVADNVFNIEGNSVSALTQETADRLRAQRAAELAPSINLLLLDEDELAVDDSYTAQQNTLFSVDAAAGVLANDNALLSPTLTLLQNVNNGSLTLNPDGSFEYLPNIDFTGADSFTYSLTTSNGQRDDATVNIRVNGMPVAIDDDFLLPSNAVFQDNVVINIVGGSDTILDGAQVVEVINESTALGGTVSIQPNGDFQYTPPVDLGNRQDSFVYTLRDNDGEADTATITWQIGVSFVGLDLPFTVLENQTLDSQFTITAPNGLQSLEVNGTSFTLAQLNTSSTSALIITGEQFGEFTITGFNELTGVLNFSYDPTGTAQDHSSAINDALTDTIAISAIDSGIAVPFDTQLLIDVLDTSPIANNDARSIPEGQSAIAGNAVGTTANATGDNPDTIVDVNANPVTDVNFGATDGTVGTNLNGGFGTFVINSAGIYTYTLDNTSAEVQGLENGESVTDVFTYTITDADGDTDSGNVTVTINGVDDAPPTITVADLNGGAAGQQSVTEGSGASVNGTVTATAEAGIKTLAVSGQDITNASTETVTITGSEGLLEVTSFNTGTGTFSYTYTEDGAANDHSTGAVTDQFTIAVSDNEDDTDTDTLSITIDDTQPSAMADSNTVTEDAASTTVSGDLLSNDISGADTPLTINDISVGDSQQITGLHGNLTINANGTYSYSLSNETAAIQALRTGQELTDTFSYTLVDTDGDSSGSTLTVTILGQDEPPEIAITDNNGVAVGDESVAEGSSTTGTFIVNAESGLATTGVALQLTDEQNNELNLTLTQLQNLAISNQSLIGIDGTITLTGYSNTSDESTISYTFDPTGTNRDHSAGDESVVEMFSIVATDDLNRAAPVDVLDILITDTAPTAAPDTGSITEDGIPNVVVGDVTTNDTSGADTAISVVGVDLNGAQTVGTPFDSDYGTLDLNSDGTYTYTLDNGNSTVQNLDAGESLTESFSYTITDTDGDESSTTLTVTINGANEPPSVTIPDVNGAGVVGEVSVPENLTTGGSFTVTAADGLAITGAALQVRDEDNDLLSLSLVQLQNLPTSNQTIVGSDGTLVLNGYTNIGNDHTIFFSFNPTGSNRDHSGGDDSVVEMFSIAATDQSGRTTVTAEVLDILITDTNPVANDDARSVFEGQTAIAGNAVGTTANATGDIPDTIIDVNANPVTDVDVGATDGTVGTNLLGGFGTFVISSAGIYTYTLDNTSTDVQGLKNGESLTDVFTYTITDSDSDTDSANVTVTIFGVDDPAPTVTVTDNNGVAAGDMSVLEGSGTNVAGSASITTSAGVKILTVAGQNVTNASTTPVSISGTDGVVEVTGFNASTGQLSYNYTENGTPNNHTAGAISDQFTITATDNEDDTASDTLVVSIDDGEPTAVADTGSITRDAIPNVITGNVFTNDTGADSKTVTQMAAFGQARSVGLEFGTIHGDFIIETNGAFTYTLDNSDSDTLSLFAGDSALETFTYTLTDVDGDASTSTLSITINGRNNTPTIVDARSLENPSTSDFGTGSETVTHLGVGDNSDEVFTVGAGGHVLFGDNSGGGGASSNNAGNGANGGGGSDTIVSGAGNDLVFADGSGGGGGGFASSSQGTGGAGGAGNDIVATGLGSDILFGDGFNGGNGVGSAGRAGGDGGYGGGGGGGGSAGGFSVFGGAGGFGGGGGGGDGDFAAPGGFGGGNGATADSSNPTDATPPTFGGGGGGALDRNVSSNAFDHSDGILSGDGGQVMLGFDGIGGGGGIGLSSHGGSVLTGSFAQDGFNGNTSRFGTGGIIQSSLAGAHTSVLNDITGRSARIFTTATGNGNDRLNGGGGSDHLFGMGGNNLFIFDVNDAGASDVDIIYDWDRGTKNLIELRDNGAAVDPAVINAMLSAAGTTGNYVFSNGAGKQVTVQVRDLANNPVVLTINDFAGIALIENGNGLFTSGFLLLADAEASQTATVAVSSVTESGTVSGMDNTTLLSFLTVPMGNVLDNTQTDTPFLYTFNSGSEAFSYLNSSESLVLTYTITASDSFGDSSTFDLVITILGS